MAKRFFYFHFFLICGYGNYENTRLIVLKLLLIRATFFQTFQFVLALVVNFNAVNCICCPGGRYSGMDEVNRAKISGATKVFKSGNSLHRDITSNMALKPLAISPLMKTYFCPFYVVSPRLSAPRSPRMVDCTDHPLKYF